MNLKPGDKVKFIDDPSLLPIVGLVGGRIYTYVGKSPHSDAIELEEYESHWTFKYINIKRFKKVQYRIIKYGKSLC